MAAALQGRLRRWRLDCGVGVLCVDSRPYDRRRDPCAAGGLRAASSTRRERPRHRGRPVAVRCRLARHSTESRDRRALSDEHLPRREGAASTCVVQRAARARRPSDDAVLPEYHATAGASIGLLLGGYLVDLRGIPFQWRVAGTIALL